MTTSTAEESTLQDLLAETQQYLAPEDLERITRAYELAERAHKGAVRRSGEPYIQHPLEVALLLADMRIDADGIIAALLHDVVEDTTYSLEDLEAVFGPTVATIVDGVTKFNILVPPVDAGRKSEKEAELSAQRAKELKRRERSETVRKMLLAMTEDSRVVVLKLADRLHNMRTLGVMNPAQQQIKARETSEIYAPLARRLGMSLAQAELEDLALLYLDPERYTWLASEVGEEMRKRQPYIERVCKALEEEMERAGIAAEIHAWQKHLASIDRKLQQSGGHVSEIHDLVSFRILLNSEHECYLALGHIHALWRPKDGRIKDFIATPKLNGYQSLHTTVFCLDNRLTEIQIRTHDMQRTADYGVASYWDLKERGETRLSLREIMTWIEQLREWEMELPQSADDFVEAVKGDIFQEQVFVFTPKGEVKELPRGSTLLDLAYRIHTDLGDHCAGARIITNMADTGRLVTRIVPLDYELLGGEIVDIVEDPAVHPTREWLSFARTTTARSKIRRYLKIYEREINLQLGRERLDLALKAAGAYGIGAVRKEDWPEVLAARKYATADELYLAIGRNSLASDTVVQHLLPLLRSRGDLVKDRALPDGQPEPVEKNSSATADKHEPATSAVMVKLAHCCYPLPGDLIVGFLSPGKGMVVHQRDCRSLRRHREQARERFVDLNWLQIESQRYLAPIVIVARDRAGLLRDVAAVVTDAGINMTAVSSTTNISSQKATINATLEIEAIEQMDRIFQRLRQIHNVVSVTRAAGRQSS